MFDPADVSNTTVQKVSFTRLYNATPHKAWIRNCKLAFHSLSHRFQLHTVTDTCWQLHWLLIYLHVWKPVAT